MHYFNEPLCSETELVIKTITFIKIVVIYYEIYTNTPC